MNPEVARLRRQSAHRKYVKRLRYVRVLWGFAGILLLALAVEVIIAVCISPRFWIYRLDVTPGETLSTPEIVRLMALPAQTNYYRAPLSQLSARIEQREPRVWHAIIHRKATGILTVEIQERLAQCRFGYDTPPRYLDGVNILFTRPVSPTPPVPVVEGVALNPPGVFGKPVSDERAHQVADCLAAVRQVFPESPGLEIARIIVAPTDRMTLVLRQGTQIFLGFPKDFSEKMWVVQKIIVYASNAGYALDQLEYIDARTPELSAGLGGHYKPKQETTEQTAAPQAVTP